MKAARLLHDRLARSTPLGNRLEGAYASQQQLRGDGIAGLVLGVKPARPPATTRNEFTAENMQAIREHSLVLHGPEARLVIPPVGEANLRAAFEAYRRELLTRLSSSEGAPDDVAKWVLDLARCQFGLKTGSLSGKTQAARWLIAESPGTEAAVRAALAIRAGRATEADVTSVRQGVQAILAVREHGPPEKP